MGCCNGSNNRSNKKVKEWGNEKEQISLKQKLMVIIAVLLFIGFTFYKLAI